jgi:hypothetical protein
LKETKLPSNGNVYFSCAKFLLYEYIVNGNRTVVHNLFYINLDNCLLKISLAHGKYECFCYLKSILEVWKKILHDNK